MSDFGRDLVALLGLLILVLALTGPWEADYFSSEAEPPEDKERGR